MKTLQSEIALMQVDMSNLKEKDEKLEFTDAKKLLSLIRDTFSPLNIAKSAVQNIISQV